MNIGLIGKMGSGKNTVADVLIRSAGYVPMAFATPLKEMVIEADPLVGYRPDLDMGVTVPIHLSDLLDSGKTFEECKRTFPEVRRSLQRIGQGVRKLDPDYWVLHLLTRILHDIPPSVPIVVTDVRYPNEADALRKNGFTLVRITRPADPRGMTMEETRAALHSSETALDDYPVDRTIRNDGSLLDLASAALDLL